MDQKITHHSLPFLVTSLDRGVYLQVIPRCRAISNLKLCMEKKKKMAAFFMTLSDSLRTHDSQDTECVCVCVCVCVRV